MPKLLNLPPARILLTLREWFNYKISHCVIFLFFSTSNFRLILNNIFNHIDNPDSVSHSSNPYPRELFFTELGERRR